LETHFPSCRGGVACFYLGFLGYAFSAHGRGLFIDAANLVVHEGGHNLFGWFGPTLGLWGGTLLQWLVPFLLAAYFFTERQVPGFIFCLFFFFENWLYTATYMADARAQQLPLVTTGDPFARVVWDDFMRDMAGHENAAAAQCSYTFGLRKSADLSDAALSRQTADDCVLRGAG
jgi:hypothetical protein